MQTHRPQGNANGPRKSAQFHKALQSNRNELLIYTTIWMDVKGIMLSERVSLKRLHTVSFHVLSVLEMTKRIGNRLVVTGVRDRCGEM